MKFEISRDGALKQLDAFINSELANYSFKRNFDLGESLNPSSLNKRAAC